MTSPYNEDERRHQESAALGTLNSGSFISVEFIYAQIKRTDGWRVMFTRGKRDVINTMRRLERKHLVEIKMGGQGCFQYKKYRLPSGEWYA